MLEVSFSFIVIVALVAFIIGLIVGVTISRPVIR
jgi:hypothetical protein